MIWNFSMHLIVVGVITLLIGIMGLSLAAFAADTDNSDKVAAKRGRSLAFGQYAIGASAIIVGIVLCVVGYLSNDQSVAGIRFWRTLETVLWIYLRIGSLFLSPVVLYFGFSLVFRHQRLFESLAGMGYRIPKLKSGDRKCILRWGIALVVVGLLRFFIFMLWEEDLRSLIF
jgi:hypothetical protein